VLKNRPHCGLKKPRYSLITTTVRTMPMLTALHGDMDSSMGFAPSPATRTTAEPAASVQQTSMKKVVLLVGVAIVVFMAFTAYSVRKEIQGGVKLAAIKELYFPVLQRLDANIVRVDKLEATYIEVAVTGDRDLFDKARDVAAEADATYAEILKLDPSAPADIKKLRSDLQRYRELAQKASLAFLQTGGADTAPMQSMNEALAATRKDLGGFRESVYNGFVDTLSSSQRDAHVRLIMGLSLGVMNLCFMAVLVYFIRNNIKMMSVIARQNATLEQRVAERTAQLSQKTSDINAMLQNMELGVCTVVPGNRIHPEYSRFLGTIFAQDQLAEKDLVEALFAKSNLGVDARDQITVSLGSILGEDPMQFAMNGHLLAREMQIADAAGGHKIVQMDWSPIANEATGSVDKVLLITQDVTQLRELQKSAASQQEELDIISKILRISIGKFNDCIHSAQGYLAANRKLLAETTRRDPEVIAALFRNMHTIKGNARTFEFTHITNAAHSAEQSYDRLRKDEQSAWNATELLAELDSVQSAVAHYLSINEEKLGRKGRASDLFTTRGVFVGNDTLAELRSMGEGLARPLTADEAARMRKAIDQLGLVPLNRIVSGSVDSISSLANELQKPAPAVDLADGDIAFNSSFAEALKGCLMHMVRNSLDHGIEAPADRVRAGKPEQGRLRIHCTRKADRVELRISDDGRGLALHELHAKGVAAGLFEESDKPTRQAVADLLFLAGVSTSNQVTQVSGRGVGMDAVRTFLSEQGASVRVALAGAQPGLNFVPFEFVIEIPRTAYTHS
jgi:HPt (histidine-containing phosphotransfer) domain-containing protein